MPITTSAKKSLRVALRRRLENLRVKKMLKEALNKQSASRLGETFSAIDKAVKAGIFHPNKGARLKSTLSKKFGARSSEKGKRKHQVARPAKRPKK